MTKNNKIVAGLLVIGSLAIGTHARQPKWLDDFLSSTSVTSSEIVNAESINKSSYTASDHTNLITDINQYIADNTNVEVAVSVVDLDNDKQYNAGETEVVFKAASTTKLIAALAYLHEVELGNATLTQRLNGTNAEQLIKQALEVSDNNAWASLNEYLGDKQQTYAQSIGLTSFTGGDYNTITAADEATLLSLLYRGKLVSDEHRSTLYGYMANADGESFIKAALPTTATVYHKYGTLWGNLHDTAIINYSGHNYALVIFTKSSDNTLDDYDNRVNLIHGLTKLVNGQIASEG